MAGRMASVTPTDGSGRTLDGFASVDPGTRTARIILGGEDGNHQVTVAGDGYAALAAINRDQFDIVLMDLQMPHMSGFEATAAIRAREAQLSLPRVPIIAMTAHAMASDAQRCLEAGMDGHIAKPVQVNALATIVAQHVSSNRQVA